MRIVEKCACGAQVEVETGDEKLVQRLVDKWRRRHNHQYSYRPYYQPYITWTSNTNATTSGAQGQFQYLTGHWDKTGSTLQDTATRRKTGEQDGS